MGEGARVENRSEAPVPGGAAAPEEDRTICFCHNVPRSELLRAIRAGAVTIAEIQARTKASTGCGGCECDVLEILARESAAGGERK